MALYSAELAGVSLEGARIADIGCGVGGALCSCILAGAEECLGVDRRAVVLQICRCLARGVGGEVTVALADAARLPCPEGHFDLILSDEAISHIRGVDDFLVEASRALAPGGALVISDANNSACPWTRARTKRLWELFERGQAGATDVGHTIQKSYQQMRAEMIAEFLPELSEEVVRELARRTTGLWGDQILRAVDEYQRTGDMPAGEYRYGTCPISPEGDYVENLISAFWLARRTRELGLRPRVYSHYGLTRNAAVRTANRLLRGIPRLTLWAAPAFRVVARKPSA